MSHHAGHPPQGLMFTEQIAIDLDDNQIEQLCNPLNYPRNC